MEQRPGNTELARKEPAARMTDTDWLLRAIPRAVRDAILEHKYVNDSVATLKEGWVLLLAPEEMPLPETSGA